MSDLAAYAICAGYADRMVLRDLSLEVASGGSVALIGPNGAGKSTMLRAIAGLVSYSGTISIDGRDLRSMSRSERAGLVALVPQAPVFPVGMTVLDYVLLGRTPHVSYWRTEGPHDIAAARMSIAALDLVDLEDRGIGTLSGGERQRAVLARALTQEPDVLLLDEPTTGLDLGHQQTFLELVERIRTERGTTIVSAIHDLTLAARYADRIVVLADGVAVASGPPAEVVTESIVRRYYGADVRVIESDGGPVVVPVISAAQTTASTKVPTK